MPEQRYNSVDRKHGNLLQLVYNVAYLLGARVNIGAMLWGHSMATKLGYPSIEVEMGPNGVVVGGRRYYSHM